jgi:hypothetical protein
MLVPTIHTENSSQICDELLEVLNIFKNDLEDKHFENAQTLILNGARSEPSSSESFLRDFEVTLNTVIRTENQNLMIQFLKDLFSIQDLDHATRQLLIWNSKV